MRLARVAPFKIYRNGVLFSSSISLERANSYVESLRNDPWYPDSTWEVKERKTVKPKFTCSIQANATIEKRPMTERRDCAVKALMNAADIDYLVAKGYVAEFCGRRESGGTSTYEWTRLLDALFKRIKRVGSTINRTIPALDPSKRYIVNVKSHTFAVINGVIVDAFSAKPLTRVEGVWEVS